MIDVIYRLDEVTIRETIRLSIVLERTTMKPKLGLRQQLWKGLRSTVIDVSVERKQFAGLCTYYYYYFFFEFWLVGVLVQY